MAFVLVVGAGLLLASFDRIRRVDLGVVPSGVLTFELNLPGARYDSSARGRFYEDAAAEFATLPGVRAAGGVSRLPATGPYHMWGVRALTGPLAGTPRGGAGGAQQRVISGDYLRVVGIQVLSGRAFDATDDVGAPAHVLVSKSLADRLYPGIRAVGQRLRTGGREAEIVGVVGEVAVDNEGRSGPYVYHPHRQFAGNRNWALTQVVALNGPRTLAQPAIRQVLAKRDPLLVMHRPAMLDDVIGTGAAQRVFTLRILLTFAAVAIALGGARIVRRVVLRCASAGPRVQHPHGPRRRAVGDSPYDPAPWNDRDGRWARDRTRRRDVIVEVDGVGAVQGEPV
jgi:hypothetical protein